MTGGRGEGEDRLIREAARWFARLRSPDGEAARPGFEAWLAADPAHLGAYNRAAEVFAMGKLLADDPQLRPPAPRPGRRRLALAAAAAALLALVAAGWMLARSPVPPDSGAAAPAGAAGDGPGGTLATLAGETRETRLPDGSRVRLAGTTRLALAFTGRERRLLLLAGAARFDVRHAPRPFVVAAGGGSVTARGTLFDVAIAPGGRVSVALLRGRVDVALPPRPGSGPVIRRLRPGDRLAFAPAPADARPAAAAPPAAAARSDALRDVRAMPLAELVAAANRGSARPIAIADPSLGARRISGRFRLGDTALLADRLAYLLDLAVDRSDPDRLVLRPR